MLAAIIPDIISPSITDRGTGQFHSLHEYVYDREQKIEMGTRRGKYREKGRVGGRKRREWITGTISLSLLAKIHIINLITLQYIHRIYNNVQYIKTMYSIVKTRRHKLRLYSELLALPDQCIFLRLPHSRTWNKGELTIILWKLCKQVPRLVIWLVMLQLQCLKQSTHSAFSLPNISESHWKGITLKSIAYGVT